MDKKVFTLAILHDTEKILLGLKKQGFGIGKWNGFGGKVEEGESIGEAALREVKEEAGVSLQALDKRGVIVFHFEGKSQALEVHIFSAFYSGGFTKSEEMEPKWFSLGDIPYDTMWPDDILWLPLLLAGKNFEGEVFFKDMETVLRHTIQEKSL